MIVPLLSIEQFVTFIAYGLFTEALFPPNFTPVNVCPFRHRYKSPDNTCQPYALSAVKK